MAGEGGAGSKSSNQIAGGKSGKSGSLKTSTSIYIDPAPVPHVYKDAVNNS